MTGIFCHFLLLQLVCGGLPILSLYKKQIGHYMECFMKFNCMEIKWIVKESNLKGAVKLC